jgi:hypothetical protein
MNEAKGNTEKRIVFFLIICLIMRGQVEYVAWPYMMRRSAIWIIDLSLLIG